jgi:hypothetical protein
MKTLLYYFLLQGALNDSGADCAPANEASERNPHNKVADGRLWY